jgi:hypothetical protein
MFKSRISRPNQIRLGAHQVSVSAKKVKKVHACVGGSDERDAVVLHLDSLRRGQHDRSVRGRQPRHTPHLPTTCFLW